mmetsp:Transcript_13997/g.33094  ORF Transcript_13997/g.33094 Transcript_13997/m.33094 type:complete len:156 (+) Transcript_13997:336-803(+)
MLKRDSMVFYLILLYSILRSFRVAAVKRGGAVAKNYGVVVWVIVFTWTVYPFVWVTAEGAHVLSEDVSVILYSCLDMVAKVTFTAAFLRLEPASLLRKRRHRAHHHIEVDTERSEPQTARRKPPRRGGRRSTPNTLSTTPHESDLTTPSNGHHAL